MCPISFYNEPWENRVAASIKIIYLNASSYQTAKGIYNKLRRDVDELDDFTWKRWGGKKWM